MPYKDDKIRREYVQTYHAMHKVEIAARQKRRYNENRKLYAERNKQYRARNRDKCRANDKRWRAENPDRVAKMRETRRTSGRFLLALCGTRERAKKYGYAACRATAPEIARAFDGRCHNPKCRIHERECTRRLHLDHDHKTGAFRGWLCGKCNTSLGHSDDSIEKLQGLVAYLSKRREDD